MPDSAHSAHTPPYPPEANRDFHRLTPTPDAAGRQNPIGSELRQKALCMDSRQPDAARSGEPNTLYWFSVNWTNAFKWLRLFLSDLPLANQGFLGHGKA